MSDGFEPWQEGDDWSHFSDIADEEEREWRERNDTQTDARQKIANVLLDIGEYDELIAESGYVDRIIAIVREALLSDEAVEDAFFRGEVFLHPDDETGTMHVVRMNTTAMLTAALDTAFGADDDGGRQ